MKCLLRSQAKGETCINPSLFWCYWVDNPVQGTHYLPGTVSLGLLEASRPLVFHEVPPTHPMLQASHLEEWLSDVVRAAYMQRLNGMTELKTDLLLTPLL